MTRCTQCEREILEPATTCGVCGDVPNARQDPAPPPIVVRAPEATSVAPVAPAVPVVPPSSPVVASARPVVATPVPPAVHAPVSAPRISSCSSSSSGSSSNSGSSSSSGSAARSGDVDACARATHGSAPDTGNSNSIRRRSSCGTASDESTHAPRCPARSGGRFSDVRHAEILDAGGSGVRSRGHEETGRAEASSIEACTCGRENECTHRCTSACARGRAGTRVRTRVAHDNGSTGSDAADHASTGSDSTGSDSDSGACCVGRAVEVERGEPRLGVEREKRRGLRAARPEQSRDLAEHCAADPGRALRGRPHADVRLYRFGTPDGGH